MTGSVPNGGAAQGQVWTDAQWIAAWQAKADDATGGTYTPPGTGAVATTVAAKLAQSLSVLDFMTAAQITNVMLRGLTVDVTTALNTALSACSTLGVAQLRIPSGAYLVSAPLNRPADVYMVGDGPEVTAIYAASTYNGNIIQSAGAFNNVFNRGGVENLAIFGIWGANHANTLSVGISSSFTNRAIYRDVRIHGCYIGVYGIGVWQDNWDNIQVDGAGTQQNNTGFYLDQLPTTLPVGTSNAVNAVNCTVQGAASEGFRLLNPNGSKFVNCESENGVNGFDIGNTSSGMNPVQFFQCDNCTSDTNTGVGFLIRQGSNAVACNYMQFSNCWASSHGQQGWFLSGCTQINLVNCIAGNNGLGGVTLLQCTECVVNGFQLVANNTTSTAAIGDITLSGGSYNRIVNNFSAMANSASVSLLETNSTNNNAIANNSFFQGATLIGAATQAFCNVGFNPVGPSGPTTVGASPATITAGQMRETHYITQSATNTAVIAKGGKTLGTLTAGTTLVVELDPGGAYQVTWLTTAPTYVKDVH